jgi:hypothetical protein
MFYIPGWISNILLFITIYVSGYQHVRLRRPNPITNLQFFMVLFCLILIVVIDMHGHDNPWLSLGFFVVALGCFLWMLRQLRYLPPREYQ